MESGRVAAPGSEWDSPDGDDDIEDLVRRSREGDEAARRRLFAACYDELRRIAGGVLAHVPWTQSLQPTELVHDVFLKLSGKRLAITDRNHFLAIAARAMRQVFLDRAKAKRRKKKGGGVGRVTLDTVTVACEDREWLSRDVARAVEQLGTVHPRAATVAMLRLAETEWKVIAAKLGISEKTARRDWDFARAWLRDALDG